MKYCMSKVKELIFEDRDDAIQVLSDLTSCAYVFGVVSVSDYYDAVRVFSNPSDYVYGWNYVTISSARVISIRSGGYCIMLPPVIKLDLN